MALIDPVFYMMRRGIRVDSLKRRELSEKAHADWEKYQKQLNLVAGGRTLNVNSPKQMREFFHEELKLPPRKNKGRITLDEDAIRAHAAAVEDKIRGLKQKQAREKWLRALVALKLVLKIRTIRKQISSYLDVTFDDDDRARSTISIGGTETMRFSHSKTLWDTGLNLATVPHPLRVMYIPDDGYELAEFDLNRGESWVYTFLSLDPELLRIHTSGGDFHSETAAAIQSAFGSRDLSVEDIIRLNQEKDEFGFRIRYLGKKVNHASAYRMGPFRGAEVVNQESDETGISITPAQMAKAQKLWAQKYLGIGNWWGSVDRSVENDRKLVTPYGRVRQFFGFMNDALKKEATAYVPQSTSVDYMNRGMLRVYHELVVPGAYGLELLHQNHDSILVQYKQEYRDEVIPEVIERLQSILVINGHEFTIPVEGSYGQNWKDLTEWEGS